MCEFELLTMCKKCNSNSASSITCSFFTLSLIVIHHHESCPLWLCETVTKKRSHSIAAIVISSLFTVIFCHYPCRVKKLQLQKKKLIAHVEFGDK